MTTMVVVGGKIRISEKRSTHEHDVFGLLGRAVPIESTVS
jgi:hypothetical protein